MIGWPSIDDETTPPEPTSSDPLPSYEREENHDEPDLSFAPLRLSNPGAVPTSAIGSKPTPIESGPTLSVTASQKELDMSKPRPETTDYPKVVPTDPPPPPPPKKAVERPMVSPSVRRVALIIVGLAVALMVARFFIWPHAAHYIFR